MADYTWIDRGNPLVLTETFPISNKRDEFDRNTLQTAHKDLSIQKLEDGTLIARRSESVIRLADVDDVLLIEGGDSVVFEVRFYRYSYVQRGMPEVSNRDDSIFEQTSNWSEEDYWVRMETIEAYEAELVPGPSNLVWDVPGMLSNISSQFKERRPALGMAVTLAQTETEVTEVPAQGSGENEYNQVLADWVEERYTDEGIPEMPIGALGPILDENGLWTGWEFPETPEP